MYQLTVNIDRRNTCKTDSTGDDLTNNSGFSTKINVGIKELPKCGLHQSADQTNKQSTMSPTVVFCLLGFVISALEAAPPGSTSEPVPIISEKIEVDPSGKYEYR